MPEPEFPFLKPGTTVTIGKIDAYGMWGREPHPPITHPTRAQDHLLAAKLYGDRPFSPLDGTVGYVAEYRGWLSVEGPTTEMVGEYSDDPEDTFNNAAAGEEDVTHFYRVVFPNFGVYEIADYEIAIAAYRDWRKPPWQEEETS